jgi:hypothetical protein
VAQLGNCDDEDQVEEELEPGRMPLLVDVLDRAEAWRLEQTGERAHALTVGVGGP